MQLSGIPAKITVPFADSGTKNTIPTAASPTPGLASFTLGFPPITMTPIAAGGIPPQGGDFNGVLNAISQATRWAMAGGTYQYDAAFSTAVGGYPKGALLLSADGSRYWQNQVDNNATNPDAGGAGWVSFGRIRLSANTTFFVSPTGNDSNNGLSAGAAFLTIQGAVNAIAGGYDFNGFNVTISVASGTYAGFSVGGPCAGQAGAAFIIAGAAGAAISTPVNSVLVGATSGARIQVSGFTLSGASAGLSGVFSGTGASIVLGAGMVFGAIPNGSHILVSDNGQVFPQANYTISGGAQAHFNASRAASIALSGIVITVTGTPAWGSSFASIQNQGLLYMSANTITGSATGVRYNVSSNALINTFGGGASYFPGSIAGTFATQGQYI